MHLNSTTVYIMRGVSGSGKSEYARKHFKNALTVSSDHFFIDKKGHYKFNASLLSEAHAACLRKFQVYLELSLKLYNKYPDIVVDNTNIHSWEIAPYHALASAHGCRVVIINLVGEPYENVHGVSAASVEKQQKGMKFERLPPHWHQKIIKKDTVIS